jgi:hypothetical protein
MVLGHTGDWDMQKHERAFLASAAAEAARHGATVKYVGNGSKGHPMFEVTLGTQSEKLVCSSSPRSGEEEARNFARQQCRRACARLAAKNNPS